MTNDTFAARLRSVRERNDWTQAQVEEWSRLPAGTVAQYEQGNREPTVTNLLALCQGLRCSADWLIGNEDHSQREVHVA